MGDQKPGLATDFRRAGLATDFTDLHRLTQIRNEVFVQLMTLHRWLIPFCVFLACGRVGVLPAQSVGQQHQFDEDRFAEWVARLPKDADHNFPYERNLYLVGGLQEARWPVRLAAHDVPEELQVAVVRALFKGACRPEWVHGWDQGTVVAALAADLTRICGIEKHIWMRELYPLLDPWGKSSEARTAQGMARGSGIFVPTGSGAFAGFDGLAVFVRTTQGRRDLFTPEYRHFLHGMTVPNPPAAAYTLYWMYPSESESLKDYPALLLRFKHVLDEHYLKASEIERSEGTDTARRYRRSALPEEAIELVSRFAREGGRPGQAMALYYYAGQPGFEHTPAIREALIASGSEYAHTRLREIAAGIREAHPDPEKEIAEARRKQPPEMAEAISRLITAAVREAQAIEEQLGGP